MNIKPEVKQACQEVLSKAYQRGRFTQREFSYLNRVIQWFERPDENICFSFGISLRDAGESQNFSITYENSFEINETHTNYDPEVGTDHFTSYSLDQDEDEYREEGDIFSWCSHALDALNFAEDEEMRLKMHIYYEEQEE